MEEMSNLTKVEKEVLKDTLKYVVESLVLDNFCEITLYRSKNDSKLYFDENQLEALKTVYQKLCN